MSAPPIPAICQKSIYASIQSQQAQIHFVKLNLTYPQQRTGNLVLQPFILQRCDPCYPYSKVVEFAMTLKCDHCLVSDATELQYISQQSLLLFINLHRCVD